MEGVENNLQKFYMIIVVNYFSENYRHHHRYNSFFFTHTYVSHFRLP